jgi:dGTPase
MPVDLNFRRRFWEQEFPRPSDDRDEYQRDKARIVHSAGFRRLQAKTQVMGVGEGDFHRTRLTHSLEVGQIGEAILTAVIHVLPETSELRRWLPTRDLIVGACYAHDLGHPPFGHGGERALHQKMVDHGGFEGNAQTLRILTRLEKYRRLQGINPTRRLLLAVLKYPIPYSSFDAEQRQRKPPKCYYDNESDIVRWVLEAPFEAGEINKFTTERDESGKPKHCSLDCSIMECADDIAYGV